MRQLLPVAGRTHQTKSCLGVKAKIAQAENRRNAETDSSRDGCTRDAPAKDTHKHQIEHDIDDATADRQNQSDLRLACGHDQGLELDLQHAHWQKADDRKSVTVAVREQYVIGTQHADDRPQEDKHQSGKGGTDDDGN